AQLSHAASAIISLTGETTTTGSSGSVDFVSGYDITVGSSALWVTSLGYYDPGHDGLADPTAQVGIYDLPGINGTLLGSVQAGTSTTNFSGDYRFIELATPIELLANTTYRVVANVGNVSGTSHNETPLEGTVTAGPDLTVNTITGYSGVVTNGGLNKTGSPSTTLHIYLGNFEYSTTPVPEPSAALLGLLSLGGLLRRRR
ncbi:MAG TPA: MYXO-CTERM sorting domain-containing protein, partial [Luteolibacter sp.]